MLIKHFIHCLLLLTFSCYSIVFADDDVNTATASGGDQIIVSPISTMLDVSDMVAVTVLVLNEDGNPIEGHKILIIPQDENIVSVDFSHTVSDASGYINFAILGKQQGNTVVTVTDGVVSSQINIAIRDLMHYVLPYFYGDMQLSLINPSEDLNYVKIKFYENSDRSIDPVVVRLESKEMKTIKLSEELDVILTDGWAEVHSTELVFGGVWTNRGYLSVYPVRE